MISSRTRTDWMLFSSVMLILGFGIVMVYSSSSVMAATLKNKPSWEYAARQIVFALIGLGCLLALKRMDYRKLDHPRWMWIAVGVVGTLLGAVLVADPVAHRWFRFGGMQLQPSELAKPAIVLFLAWFVSRRENEINDKYTLMPAGLVVGGLTLMIAWGDLGTAVIVLVPAAVVFYVAGIERRFFYLTLVVAFLAGCLFVLQKPYRLFRILPASVTEESIKDVKALSWLAPHMAASRAARDSDHQPRQARIAVGSGGVTGVGLGNSRQKLGFLPEAHNDFIFGVIGEETGLAGSMMLLGAYMLIFWRGFRLYWTAEDVFGRYMALGCTSLITAQALFNMSVVLRLAPTKGIPLPLVSYGGSALICTLITIGLLMSVSERASD